MVLQALAALLDGALAKLAGNEQLDGCLDVLRGERLLLAIDDKHASLRHQVVKGVGHDRVHGLHGLLGDANLLLFAADLLEHSEDVGVEGIRIPAFLGAPHSRCLLLLLKLADGRARDLGFLVGAYRS